MPRMIEVVRVARELAHILLLASLVVRELLPSPDRGDTDAEMERTIREGVETFHHPVGTCRMGPPSDDAAVVDARGRVHGVDALSVADASIMPSISAGNTNLPTIMVAERVADWVRQDG